MKVMQYIVWFACSLFVACETPRKEELSIWYKQPAKEWVEALPVGNGRLGAMVFGRTDNELIQLNEGTLWSGRPVDLNPNPEAVDYLTQVREALFKGEWSKAESLCRRMQGNYTESYLPLADLQIDYSYEQDVDSVSGYRRALYLSEALTDVHYKYGEIAYDREVFVSSPDQAIVVKLSASEKGKLGFSASLSSLLENEVSEADGCLLMKGVAPVHVDPSYLSSSNPVIYVDENGNKGMRFAVKMFAETDGKISFEQNQLRISDASKAVLKLVAATSFNGFDKDPQKEGKDELALTNAYMDKVKDKSYTHLKQAHIDDYQGYFNRVSFVLGDKHSVDSRDTRERLLAYKVGKEDLPLEALYYQYNRYLLISCSRPGNLPANLQGIWNQLLRAPWSSNYTINVNAEMNYWSAEVCNLSDLHQPLLEQIKRTSVNGEQTAKNFYHAGGWSLSHNSDIWCQTNPVGNKGLGDPGWANWYMGSPWMCQHLYEHYRFTGDKFYLEKEAYPVMKKAALFCLDWLIEDGEGHLVTAPSTSPENRFIAEDGKSYNVSIATTMDMSIIWDLFTNLIEAADILDIDVDFKKMLIEKRARLYPLQIGKKGNLQEWFKDYEDADPHHRHVSHLFGLHPGRQITPFHTSDLAKACKKTLELRGDNGTGWSLAWKINFWARLLDGNHAYKLLRRLLYMVDTQQENYDGGGSYINLFCAHPPFQIDGNFGGLSGMTEMLLQSQNDEIHLLPALPSAWRCGQIRGLCARKGFVVDISWKDGVLQAGTVYSRLGNDCVIRTSVPVQVKGVDAKVEKQETDWGVYYVLSFKTEGGKNYQIKRI